MLHISKTFISALAVSGLVKNIPNANSFIVRVFCNYFTYHFAKTRIFIRVIKNTITRTRKLSVRRITPAAMPSPINILRAELGFLIIFLRNSTIIAEAYHCCYSIAVCSRKISVKIFHKGVVLFVPNLKLKYKSYTVKAQIRHGRKFSLCGLKAILKAIALPLIDAICTIAAHKIASANPWL